MSTPITTPPSGFFAELLPLLADRTLMVIVSKTDDQHLTLSVVPKRMKDGENSALATPLCCTGTPEELDRDLPSHLRDFVAGHVALSNNLAQIQRERDEAEKAAREELKKKQKSGSAAKAKVADVTTREEQKPAASATALGTMSLFDAPTEAPPQAAPNSVAAQRNDGATTTTTDNNNCRMPE
jgi:PRTRC genetic system protein E